MTQIHFNHFGIVLNCIHAACSEQLALMQNGDQPTDITDFSVEEIATLFCTLLLWDYQLYLKDTKHNHRMAKILVRLNPFAYEITFEEVATGLMAATKKGNNGNAAEG